MIRIGVKSISIEDILSRTTEVDILQYYFNINKLPALIASPFREDRKPSFGIYTSDDKKVSYRDFSTRESGGIFDMLMKYWGVSYSSALNRVWEDLPNFSNSNITIKRNPVKITRIKERSDTRLECRIREWKEHDIKYWESYGISLKWLKWAEVYPISHKIITGEGKRYVFGADKYAYAYVEHKDGNTTLKIYQPFNKSGFKWSNKHDRSVISLWTKVPEYGDKICICSSLKDALCLSCNTGIPAIAIQGEGYGMSDTAVNELKRRYKKIYILLDNDKTGLADGISLSKSTGFTNIILPEFEGGKDISDLYKSKGKDKFLEIILPLFY